MRPIRLAFVLKDADLARLYDLKKLLLIVVMLIGRLMWVYYQQTAMTSFQLLTDRPTPSVTVRFLIMYGILLRPLFFVAAVVYSGSWDFLYDRVSELYHAYFSRHLF